MKTSPSNLLPVITLIAALALGQQHFSGKPYNPVGPKIEVLMSNGLTFQITTDPKRVPQTAAHILALVRKGFYDDQRIYRVEPWITQWGHPATKWVPSLDVQVKQPDGTFKTELHPKVDHTGSGQNIPVFEGSTELEFERGIVGVAAPGYQEPGDCHIYVVKKHNPRLLNSYAILGKVTRGMETVGKIQRGDRIKRMWVVE